MRSAACSEKHPDPTGGSAPILFRLNRNLYFYNLIFMPGEERSLSADRWDELMASLPSVDADFARDVMRGRESVGPPPDHDALWRAFDAAADDTPTE